MKRAILGGLLAGGCLMLIGCRAPGGRTAAGDRRETITQVSTIDAVMAGAYDGQMTLGELKRYGDFGLGTFHALDGEMTAVDGEFYQVRSDGKVLRVPEAMTTPFADVTFFDEDRKLDLPAGTTFATLEELVDKILPTLNLFYAVRVEGAFDYVKARSVPAQSKPYPPLSEAVKQQKEFEFRDVKGTLVGFRSPPFAKGVNVPGYHLHFIAEDLSGGGHVLDFILKEGVLSIDDTPEFYLVLPTRGEEFFSADLSRDRAQELHAVER